jgi:hypothetical protein
MVPHFRGDSVRSGRAPEVLRFDDDMAELSLLLPSWQMVALEEAAQAQGLTTAQLVRRLIRDFFLGAHNLPATAGLPTP